jgi:hypothetical protein
VVAGSFQLCIILRQKWYEALPLVYPNKFKIFLSIDLDVICEVQEIMGIEQSWPV